MLDAAREPTLPAAPRVSRRAFGLQFLQKVVAAKCATLLSTETAEADDHNEQPEVVEEPESAQIRYLLQWIRSDEGIVMKQTLEKAIDTLNDPSYEIRQEAMKTIIKSIDTLKRMIFPFPEELRQVLGTGLFPSNLYGEFFRKEMCEKYGSTTDQALNFDAIQEVRRATDRNAVPCIMPGEYSHEDLLNALEMQTGLRIRLAHSSPAVGTVVTAERNEWGHVIQDWCTKLGGWGAEYEWTDTTMYIVEHPHPQKTIVFRGPDFYVHERFPSDSSNTTVMRAPAIGEFLEPFRAVGNANHRLYIEGIPGLGYHERILCDILDGSRQEIHYGIVNGVIPTVTSVRRRTQKVAIGSERAPLGRYQNIRTYAQETSSAWKVTLDIHIAEDIQPWMYANSGIDLLGNVVWKNEYEFYDAAGEIIEPNKFPRETVVTGGDFCEYELPTKPAYVHIKYIPDLHQVGLPVPTACLPKNTNP